MAFLRKYYDAGTFIVSGRKLGTAASSSPSVKQEAIDGSSREDLFHSPASPTFVISNSAPASRERHPLGASRERTARRHDPTNRKRRYARNTPLPEPRSL
jgi:hypothetical protein